MNADFAKYIKEILNLSIILILNYYLLIFLFLKNIHPKLRKKLFIKVILLIYYLKIKI
jgi:hypothetical protein